MSPREPLVPTAFSGRPDVDAVPRSFELLVSDEELGLA